MQLFEIIIYLILLFFGIMFIFNGFSIINYNSNINKVSATINEKVVLSDSSDNCITLVDGNKLCNYNVTYDSVNTTIGSNKQLDSGSNIDIYINEKDNTISTNEPMIPTWVGWTYIILGVLNLLFLFFMFYNKNKYNSYYSNIERDNCIFGDDEIIII